MSNISEQIRERFINSIPDIDEKDLKISIENTIKNCSVSNSFDRSSFFGASLRLFKGAVYNFCNDPVYNDSVYLSII